MRQQKRQTTSNAKQKNKRKWLERLQTITIGGEKDRERILEDLSMLLDAGMDASTALLAIGKDMKKKWLKKYIDQLRFDVDNGMPLWKAFESHGKIPQHAIALMRIGEEAGQLVENLNSIIEQQQKDRIFRAKVQSAMMYPIFILSVTGIIGIGIAWFILPRLAEVFGSLDLEVPLITRILIWLGLFLKDHGTVAVPIASLLVILSIYVIFFFKHTRFIGQWILFMLPGIHRLMQEIEVSRFGFTLGTLLKAGLPIDSSIASLKESTLFNKYANFYVDLKRYVEEGETFAYAFEHQKRMGRLIPSSVQQLVETSERSGQLPETLYRIGGMFEQKIDTTTKNLSTILEPVLLVIVWLGVVGVALSVILPIYSLVGSLTSTVTSSPASPASIAELEEVEGPVELEPIDSSVLVEEILDDIGLSPVSSLEVASPTGVLNVRTIPSTDGEVIVQISNGEQYDWLQERDDWYEVQIDESITGWVFGPYVILP